MNTYYGTYTDRHGTEPLVIYNDGSVLHLHIRGAQYSGRDFDSLELITSTVSSEDDKLFVFSTSGELCECTLVFDLSMMIIVGGENDTAKLHVKLILGSPCSDGGIDNEELYLTLTYKNLAIDSGRSDGYFETAFQNIQRKLPADIHLKSCINCLYGDYPPGGNGSFGHMFCFRNVKKEYLAIRSKSEYFDLIEGLDQLVQEIHVCEDFSSRSGGA